LHNPLRSEAEMFHVVVIVGAGCAAVIALTLLTGPEYGLLFAMALVGFGLVLAWRGSRGAEPHKAEIAHGDGSKYRLLVIANETVGGKALLEEIRSRCEGRPAEILVVTPALARSAAKLYSGEVDEAIAEARERREESVRAIRALGLDARGEVGDCDPNVAIEDALLTFPADELIISTHPPWRSRWLERGVVEKARREVDLPITHVVTDLEAERAATAA
jgi:DNA-binding transcriptional LysR family regulator